MFSASSCVRSCSYVFCFNRATELPSLERRIWSSQREDEHTLDSPAQIRRECALSADSDAAVWDLYWKVGCASLQQRDRTWLCEIQPKRDAIMLPDGVSMVTDGCILECKVQRLSLKNTKTAMKEVFHLSPVLWGKCVIATKGGKNRSRRPSSKMKKH